MISSSEQNCIFRERDERRIKKKKNSTEKGHPENWRPSDREALGGKKKKKEETWKKEGKRKKKKRKCMVYV